MNAIDTFTVRAENTDGTLDTTYRGLLTLCSPATAGTTTCTNTTAPDGAGAISADSVNMTSQGNPITYQFTAGDGGTHTFGARWNAAGTKSLTVTDTVAAEASQSANAQGITVGGTSTANITLTPTTATPGQTITINGSGFNPSQTVTVTDNGVSLGSSRTNGSGQIVNVSNNPGDTFPASSTSGSHTVVATDQGGRSANASYTVSGSTGGATITLTPTTATPGQTITINGSGFNPSQTITVTDNGTSLGTTRSNASGQIVNVSGALGDTLPASTVAGTPTVIATDQGGRSGSTSYTVSGTGNGTCPAGYQLSGTSCVPCPTSTSGYGQYPYTQQYPYNNTQQSPYGGYNGYCGTAGACPTGYYYNGTTCIPGANPAGACPAGYTFNGYACAYGVTPPPTVVAPPAPVTQQVSPASQTRVPFTGNHTVRMVALALSLLLGGLMLLSARAVVGSRKA